MFLCVAGSRNLKVIPVSDALPDIPVRIHPYKENGCVGSSESVSHNMFAKGLGND